MMGGITDQAARDSFAAEIFRARNHGDLGGGASAQSESAPADLARAALEIAAEDDALISHSPVPLPVDAYLARLDSMAAELAGHHLLPNACDRTPEAVFRVMDSYIYGYMVRTLLPTHLPKPLAKSSRPWPEMIGFRVFPGRL